MIITLLSLQALQEISVEERKRTLENNKSELQSVKKKLEVLNGDIKVYDKRVQESVKKVLFLNYVEIPQRFIGIILCLDIH